MTDTLKREWDREAGPRGLPSHDELLARFKEPDGRIVMARLIQAFLPKRERAFHAFAVLILAVDEYDQAEQFPPRSPAAWRAAERVWRAARRLIGAGPMTADRDPVGLALAAVGRRVLLVVSGRWPED